MKKHKILLGIFLLSLISCTIGSSVNIQLRNDNFAQPKTSAYSGITVGLAWTYTRNINHYDFDGNISGTEVDHYESIKVTLVNSSGIYVQYYRDGEPFSSHYLIQFVYDSWIGGGSVLSDSEISSYVTTYGTYTAEYGGRTLTVVDTGRGQVWDTDTGIIVEDHIFFGPVYITLISWDIYSQSSSISGYSWILMSLAIIGTSTYLLKRRYNKRT